MKTQTEILALAKLHCAIRTTRNNFTTEDAFTFTESGLTAFAAALPAHPTASGSVPGWKLVPIDPTPEMIDAMAKGRVLQAFVGAQEKSDKRLADSYRAWLASAPVAPALSAEPVLYQYRHQEQHPQTVNFGEWGEWQTCSLQKMQEIEHYIKGGYSYETRKLYTAALMEPAVALPAEPETFRPMSTAPRDATIVRLLVNFDDNALEDTPDPVQTIGHNNFDHDGEDCWQFAGWCWQQDHYTEGKGTPIGWLPFATPTAQAEPKQMAIDDEVLEAMRVVDWELFGAQSAKDHYAALAGAALKTFCAQLEATALNKDLQMGDRLQRIVAQIAERGKA